MFATSALTAGQAAKLIVLDAMPLGLSPSVFDPAADGAAVDLGAIVDAGAQPDGSYGAFNATLYSALAKRLIAGTVLATTLTLIRAAQQANGGWGFSGDPTGTDIDPDTTGLAIQALVAGGATATDPAIAGALNLLATNQNPNGSWASSSDSGNPNSTAVAIQAITAVGYDPTLSCWRDSADAAKVGTPYVSPDTWLRSEQTAAGNIASPNDQFGLNTFPTTQAVQALLHHWLPIARATASPCPVSTPTTATTAVPDATAGVPTSAQSAIAGRSTSTTARSLPKTGSTSVPVMVAGGLLLAGGAGLAVSRRRGHG